MSRGAGCYQAISIDRPGKCDCSLNSRYAFGRLCQAPPEAVNDAVLHFVTPR